MNRKVRLWPVPAYAATALLLSAALGCSSGASRSDRQNPAPAEAAPALADGNPGINLQCDADRIRNASAPFHWSYRKVVPPLTNADWEVDVTPASILGSVTDGSGTRLIHGLRSDNTSWDTSVAILTDALPGSTFALVNNSSAVMRAGSESVNGKRAIRYAIDTSRDIPADASLIRNVLGSNGFIKGTAWVNAQGCPIKFVLDVQQYYADGTLHREHDEADATQR